MEERPGYPSSSTSSEALKSTIMGDGFSKNDDSDSDSDPDFDNDDDDSNSDDDAIKAVAEIVAGGAVALFKYLKKKQQRS